MGRGGGKGWPKAMAWAAKGGPTRGKEKICFPSRNTNNRKNNFQTGAAPMQPRRKIFFALLVAQGQHGHFPPWQAGCTGIREDIETEGTTQARDNRNQGRGAASLDIFATTTTHKTTGRGTTWPPTSVPHRLKSTHKAPTEFLSYISVNDTRCIFVCAPLGQVRKYTKRAWLFA